MNSETIEIYLNSKSATNYVNNQISDCYYNLPNIELSQDEIAYVSLKDAVIPYSFYNVNNTNNKLDFILDAINCSITLTNGYYNVNTLKQHIYELLFSYDYGAGNNNHNHWTINYISKLNKYEFIHQFHNFTFLSSSTCFELLGFINNISYTSTSLKLTSSICCNTFTIKNIYVSSDNFILNNVDSNNHNRSNIICSIPVKGLYNSILFYEDSSKHLVYKLDNIVNLHIKLTDQDNNLLDMNNLHYTLTIEITIVKK
jgi:hypothetical protein